MKILETKDLTYTYGIGTPFEHTALDHVDFNVNKGEIMGIIGHTGSGKSTLIQHLNGLLKPTSGKILLNGTDIWEKKENIKDVRFKVGLVFQYPEYQLFEETVEKDIAYGPKNQKLSDAEVHERVLEAAKFAGVDESLLSQSPFELSGGQKRRVAIAGIIAMQPEVLVLDEPTAGLDPSSKDKLLSNIVAYQKEKGTTVIIVTHNMEDVAVLVDRLTVMDHSKILYCGTPKEVFAHAEELKRSGLAVPQITEVFLQLQKMGLNVSHDIYTVDDAIKELSLLKGERQC